MSNLIRDLVELVERRPGASFPEIQRHLAESGHTTTGSYEMTPGERSDLVYWGGLSPELIDAMLTARERGLIHMHLLLTEFEAVMVYLADGGLPPYPLVGPRATQPYKSPRWIPIVWYSGHHCDAENCAPRVYPWEVSNV